MPYPAFQDKRFNPAFERQAAYRNTRPTPLAATYTFPWLSVLVMTAVTILLLGMPCRAADMPFETGGGSGYFILATASESTGLFVVFGLCLLALIVGLRLVLRTSTECAKHK